MCGGALRCIWVVLWRAFGMCFGDAVGFCFGGCCVGARASHRLHILRRLSIYSIGFMYIVCVLEVYLMVIVCIDLNLMKSKTFMVFVCIDRNIMNSKNSNLSSWFTHDWFSSTSCLLSNHCLPIIVSF